MNNKKTKTNISIANSHRISFSTSLFLCNISTLDESWFASNEICNFTKLYYILEGEISVHINGEEVVAHAGDFLLIPSGTVHGYKAITKSRLYWADVDLGFNTHDFAVVMALPNKITVGGSYKLQTLFKKLIDNKNQEADNAYLASVYQSSYITQILEFYIERCSRDDIQSIEPSNDPIYPIIEYLNSHYTEKVTVKDLAMRACMSANYFTVRFKKLTGLPPLQYINNVKMKKAQEMLEKTTMSVSEIVRELNYYDPPKFCKAFKKLYGISPMQYRKLSQKGSILKNSNE